jgi:hypothetical protein
MTIQSPRVSSAEWISGSLGRLQAHRPMTDSDQTSFEPSGGNRMVARRAILVTPKQAYFDWLLTMGDDGKEAENMEREPDRWPRVLLVPAFIDGDDARLFFAEHGGEVLEDVLDMALDKPIWPKKRDLERFLEWFDVVHADTINDHGHGKFYVETGEEFIGDDYHALVKEFLVRQAPPPRALKVEVDDYRSTLETRSRLDSVVLLARYFTWCKRRPQGKCEDRRRCAHLSARPRDRTAR